MPGFIEVLNAGASLVAIVGAGFEVYRFVKRRAGLPVVGAVPASPGGGAPTGTPTAPLPPAQPVERVPTTPPTATAPSHGLSPYPHVPDDTGWGAFFMGAWLLLVLVSGLGWAVNPEEALRVGGGTPEAEAASSLRYLAVALFVNTVWAGLLAWRHRPRPGQSLGKIKDRFWVYLIAAVGSPVAGVLLVPVIADLAA